MNAWLFDRGPGVSLYSLTLFDRSHRFSAWWVWTIHV
jgi:hypothetical protein